MVFTPLLSQTSTAHMDSAVIVAKPRAPPCPTWRWRDGYSVLLDISSMPQCSWPISGNFPHWLPSQPLALVLPGTFGTGHLCGGRCLPPRSL